MDKAGPTFFLPIDKMNKDDLILIFSLTLKDHSTGAPY